MGKKIHPSWENPRDDSPHSPEGIESIKFEVKYGLNKLYKGIGQAMWRYEGMDKEEKFADTLRMSRDNVPEKGLMIHGELCTFKYGDQLYMLPPAYQGGLNIYGYMDKWRPVPYGYDPDKSYGPDDIIGKFSRLNLTSKDSVIIRNDRFGTGDALYIEKMVDLLVDNILDTNQLQLIASNPIFFNVTPDNLLTAKRVYLDMAEHKPVIYKNDLGDKVVPQVEQLNVKIDPSLFEIFDRFECNLLSYLGFPCVPITKRAQQSVSEVQSNDDKVHLRRMEKLHQREMAVERINKMFDTNIKVVSVIDEIQEQQRQQAQMEQDNMRGGNDE